MNLFAPTHEHAIEASCPNCDRKVQFATGGPQAPTEGDLMVCFKCASIQIVTADHTLRAATAEDRASWTEEEREGVEEAIQIIRAGWRPK